MAGGNNWGWRTRVEGGAEEKNLSLKPQSSHFSTFFPTRHLLWARMLYLLSFIFMNIINRSLLFPKTWDYLLSLRNFCGVYVCWKAHRLDPQESLFCTSVSLTMCISVDGQTCAPTTWDRNVSVPSSLPPFLLSSLPPFFSSFLPFCVYVGMEKNWLFLKSGPSVSV